MVTRQLAIVIAISICIGSGVALETFAAAPASPTRIDFDQVFADVSHACHGARRHLRRRLIVVK